MKLSIAMSHYNDFDGVWFTIQDIKKELLFNGKGDILNEIQFVIVDNSHGSSHSEELKKFVSTDLYPCIYEIYSEKSTSLVTNKLIEICDSDFVLVLDSHVLLCPTVEVIEKVFNFIEENPETEDLYYGQCVDTRMSVSYSFFKKEWADSNMWGDWCVGYRCECGGSYFTFDKDARPHDCLTQEVFDKCPKCGVNLSFENVEEEFEDKQEFFKSLTDEGMELISQIKSEKPFEIWAQSPGCFLVKKDSWLGYNEYAKNFGGESGYIAEKYRKNGKKVFCLPFLKWLHKFQKPNGITFNADLHSKVRNYVIEFTEIEYPLDDLRDHFVGKVGYDSTLFESFVNEAKFLYKKD